MIKRLQSGISETDLTFFPKVFVDKEKSRTYNIYEQLFNELVFNY